MLLPEHAAWLTYHEGKLASDRCQWELAETLFKKLLDDKTIEPHLQAMVHNRLGMIRDELRDYSTAIQYYQEAFDLAKSPPSRGENDSSRHSRPWSSVP